MKNKDGGIMGECCGPEIDASNLKSSWGDIDELKHIVELQRESARDDVARQTLHVMIELIKEIHNINKTLRRRDIEGMPACK